MARAKRQNKSKIKTEVTPILNGVSYIYKCEASGDVWQFRMYIRTDKQHFRQYRLQTLLRQHSQNIHSIRTRY